MAYVSTGNYKSEIKTEWKTSGYVDRKQEDLTLISLDDGYAMCFKKTRDSNYGGNVFKYELISFEISTGEYSFKGKSTLTRLTTYYPKDSDPYIIRNDYENALGSTNDGINDTDDYIQKFKFYTSTDIPIFDNQTDIDNYIKTGDTSNQLNTLDLNTDWTLYIDGKSNPLYKLTWECNGLNNLDTSYTTINIWVGSFNSLDNSFNDVDGTKFKEVPFNNGSIKFSYSDISKLVEQPLIGHNPACIRVQLAYRKFETAKVETSTSMGCDLYYSSVAQ